MLQRLFRKIASEAKPTPHSKRLKSGADRRDLDGLSWARRDPPSLRFGAAPGLRRVVPKDGPRRRLCGVGFSPYLFPALALARWGRPRQLIVVKLYIIAGESSGDGHGAVLMSELLAMAPDIEFYGAGGPKMREVGGSHIFDWTQEAVVGLWDVLMKYPYFREQFHRL